MPFCTSCGRPVGESDAYCAQCGSRQPSAGPDPNPSSGPSGAPPFAPADPLSNIPPRTLATLCYIPIVGWVASVIVLGARRFRQDYTMRFHAFQGLYIFAAWLLVDWAIQPIFSSLPHHVFRVDHLLQAVLFGVWIFMLIKSSQGQAYSLPILGELATRSAREK